MWKIIAPLSNILARTHTVGYKRGLTPAIMRKSTVCTNVSCLLLAAKPYSDAADATEDKPNNASETGVHDSLVAALTHAGLVATLQGDGPFTVFAPTDQAFAARVLIFPHLIHRKKMRHSQTFCCTTFSLEVSTPLRSPTDYPSSWLMETRLPSPLATIAS